MMSAPDLVERVKGLSKAIIDGLPRDCPPDVAIQASLDAAICILRAVTEKRASEACYDLADILITMGAAEATIEPPELKPAGNLHDNMAHLCPPKGGDSDG